MRTKTLILFLLSVLILFCLGCTEKEDNQTEILDYDWIASLNVDKLENIDKQALAGSWELTAFVDTLDGKVEFIPDEMQKPVFITFYENSISGRTVDNAFAANYQLQENKIRFSDIIKTESTESEWSKTLLDAIYDTDFITVLNGKMYIRSEDKWFVFTLNNDLTDDESNSLVPFAPCSCEGKEEINPGTGIIREVYLFNDSIPKEIKREFFVTAYSDDNAIVTWIIYNRETNSADMTTITGIMEGYGVICNYPDYAKNWNIPKEGWVGYYGGKSFRPCIPLGGIATVGYFDLILTTLKLK